MATAIRTTQMIGFSVPPSTAREYEHMAEKERRTKSELFREMFRMYQTYRKGARKANEERFRRLVDEDIREGLQDIRAHRTSGAFKNIGEFDEYIKRTS